MTEFATTNDVDMINVKTAHFCLFAICVDIYLICFYNLFVVLYYMEGMATVTVTRLTGRKRFDFVIENASKFTEFEFVNSACIRIFYTQ